MFLRKSTLVMFIALAAMSLTIANVSYAEKYLDHLGGKGIDGADNQKKTEDEIGGRGADVGYITPYQHGIVNATIANAFANHAIDKINLYSIDDQVLLEGIKKYQLEGFMVVDLEANTGIAGHYGIRRGAVYVDPKGYKRAGEYERTGGIVAKHELYELIKLLDWAKEVGLARDQLVKELNDPTFSEKAKKILQQIHDNNPYKITGPYNIAPKHMPNLGVRGAAGNAAVGDNIEVSDGAEIVLTKNQFFETNLVDSNIITLPGSAILDGSIATKDIYDLAQQQGISISIMVTNAPEAVAVNKKFADEGYAAQLEELIKQVKLAFVQINDDTIMLALREFLKGNQLGQCTLDSFNKYIKKSYGVQI